METQLGNKDRKTVYTIVERGRDAKSYWVKVGVGFVNRDGSINLRLDAVPVNGTLQVRDFEPFDVARRAQDNGAPRLPARDNSADSGVDSLI